jgi:hypothetical protein
VSSLVVAALYRKLTVKMLHDSFFATMRLTAMSILILAMAFYLNFAPGLLGVTQSLAGLVKSLDVSAVQLSGVLAIFYLLLGVFFETLPMLVGTTSIVFPFVTAAGIDPVFFGVFIVLMCEISLISPPVGMTLYVIQGCAARAPSTRCSRARIPFFISMIVMTGLLIHFPEMALWLPQLTFRQVGWPAIRLARSISSSTGDARDHTAQAATQPGICLQGGRCRRDRGRKRRGRRHARSAFGGPAGMRRRGSSMYPPDPRARA